MVLASLLNTIKDISYLHRSKFKNKNNSNNNNNNCYYYCYCYSYYYSNKSYITRTKSRLTLLTQLSPASWCTEEEKEDVKVCLLWALRSSKLPLVWQELSIPTQTPSTFHCAKIVRVEVSMMQDILP